MTVYFNCQCGQSLTSQPESAGQQVQCPNCNSILIVPHPVAPAAAPIAAPPKQTPPPSTPHQPPIQSPNPQMMQPPVVGPPGHQVAPPPQTGAGFTPGNNVGPSAQQMGAPYSQAGAYASSVRGQKSKVGGLGIGAGILAIAFALAHLACGGMLGVVSSFIGDVQDSVSQAGGGSFFDKYFGYVHMGLGTVIVLLVGYALMTIAGAVGLFQGQFWGWIVSNVSAAVAVIIAIFLFIAYMKTLSGLNVVDKSIDRAANQSQVSQEDAEFVRQANDMGREQVHWSALLVIGFYGGYAVIMGICLLNPSSIREYRNG